MSFLNQLKSQAQALQGLRTADDLRLGERTDQTEESCRRVLAHLQDLGQLHFRLLNTRGFEVMQSDLAAARVDAVLLDELGKRIVGQPTLFV